MTVELARFTLAAPDDLSGLEASLTQWGPSHIRKLALFFKCPGEYEDGSRERARGAVDWLLGPLGLADRTEMVTVIGSEGVSTPFGYAFADLDHPPGPSSGPARLAIGLAHGQPPADEDLDRAAFAPSIADIVGKAIADAGLAPADVACVIVNVPQPVHGAIGARGRKARALAALAAGVALGEIEAGAVMDAAIGADENLFTRKVQTFAGPTVKQVEAIVIGNRAGAGGDLVARVAIMDDLLDTRPVKRMLIDAGLRLDALGEFADPDRVVAAIVKSGAAANGRVRGAPTTIHSSAIGPEKHVRAAHSGLFGAMFATTCVFNTYDPIQQAPVGGVHVLTIARV